MYIYNSYSLIAISFENTVRYTAKLVACSWTEAVMQKVHKKHWILVKPNLRFKPQQCFLFHSGGMPTRAQDCVLTSLCVVFVIPCHCGSSILLVLDARLCVHVFACLDVGEWDGGEWVCVRVCLCGCVWAMFGLHARWVEVIWNWVVFNAWT